MTRHEALVEAQRRWGADGCALLEAPGERFQVGVWPTCDDTKCADRGHRFHLYGASGDSWEAAFRDADARSSR